ncbi:MAG: acyltransferase family protein [Ruminococcaceae bacterium]|nr:acyltransferase family protein [Oscillospiraceae bacterium]
MSERNETLDIIRIISLLCINGVHFFVNSGFYSAPVEGGEMMLMCVFRSLFLICVPMFLMLSGYLMNQKAPSKKYFWGITKTIIIYFLCSVVFSLFLKFVQGEEMTLKIFITNLFGFEGTKYAWYIEMYLGLYLIIPFLNIIFNNLKDKKQALYLLGALFAVCMLPSFVNIFRFEEAEWWLDPGSSKEYFQILPQWWDRLYPIFFYFLGAYLSKYKPALPVVANAALLICSVVFDGAFSFYRSMGHSYVWGDWNSNTSPTTALTAFLTFSLLLNFKFKKKSKSRSSLLKLMSDSCIFAFLLSGIFDLYLYDIFKAKIPEVQDRFAYAPLMILTVYICSLCSGIVVNVLYREFQKGVRELIEAVKSIFKKKPKRDLKNDSNIIRT